MFRKRILYKLSQNVVSCTSQEFYVDRLNIARIKEIRAKSRLFCLYDQDYKCQVLIKYYNPDPYKSRNEIKRSDYMDNVRKNVYIENDGLYDYLDIRYKDIFDANRDCEEIDILRKYLYYLSTGSVYNHHISTDRFTVDDITNDSDLLFNIISKNTLIMYKIKK